MMLVHKNVFTKRLGKFVGVAVMLSCVQCFALSDNPTTTELYKESLRLMAAGQLEDAVDTMYWYLTEVDQAKNKRVISIAQDIRYKMANILMSLDRMDEAASILQKYIDTPYGNNRGRAMQMLAGCYYESDLYEECVGAATNALAYNADPALYLSQKAAAQTMEEDGDNEDSVAFKGKIVDEPKYTTDELVMLQLALGESFFALGRWASCIEPFEYVIENTSDEQRKGYGIMQVIDALIELADYDRITDWIPQLYRTNARFDIRVNMALLNAAFALYEAGEHDSALPLYRMILPRDELVTYQERRLRELRIAAGLPPEPDAELTADEMLLFGIDEESESEVEEVDERPKNVRDLEALIDALKKMAPYGSNVDYQIAELYRAVERYWEAASFYAKVFAAVPESKIGERAIVDLISVLLDDLDELAEAKEYGFEYMSGHTDGEVPRMVAYLFAGYYQKNDDWPKVKGLLPYLEGFVRSNDEKLARYDTELYYMQALADLVMQNYDMAEKSFKRVLDEFPESHQEGNCLYWYGMTHLFQQKYEGAKSIFDQYVQKFPEGTWVDEALYQGGVCMFGLEELEDARDRFSHIIENYPDSSVFSDACSMRGDIFGSEGLLDEAIADYTVAIENAKKVNQATYAVFQMAATFEAEERHSEIIGVVEDYLEQWGGEADISKALFWIGKTRIDQGLIAEAVDTYIGAIVTYGKDVRQDGVDLMIAELVRISAMWLDTEGQEKLISDLQAALDRSFDLTLQLRLRVTIAMLEHNEVELGKKLITELPDLENASPPVLATICDASFEMEDYSRAEEMLEIFIVKFEDSDYMRAAYKLLGYGRYAAKDYEGALATIAEAQEIYGTERDVAWAQLMKAQILFDMGKIDEAREANLNVLNVASWRGAPVAQATYQLGQVAEKEGDFLKAFGFYQRTYFQYKGHAGGFWAAEAYLASARCLKMLGLENDRRNTYRAILFDRYVNTLPQAEVARTALGAAEVAEIEALLTAGTVTNIAIEVETEALTTAGGDTAEAAPEEPAVVTEEAHVEGEV